MSLDEGQLYREPAKRYYAGVTQDELHERVVNIVYEVFQLLDYASLMRRNREITLEIDDQVFHIRVDVQAEMEEQHSKH